MAHDVFISYSSHDKPVADAVCATLEAKKIRCWIAPRDVLAGIPYAEALNDALQASQVLVLVLSGNSNDSPHVMREVESAVHRGIPIVPLRIENIQPSKSLDYFLKSIHWLDAITPPLERHLERLGDTVQLVLERQKAGEDGHAVLSTTSAEAAAGEQAGVRRSQLVAALAIGGVLLFGAVVVGWLAATGRLTPKPPAQIAKNDAAHRAKSGEPAARAEQKAQGESKAETSAEVPISNEDAIRQLITEHYAAMVRKDAEACLATFRPMADAKLEEGRQQAIRDIIADTGKVELKRLEIENIQMSGEFATAHVTVLLSGLDVFSRKPYFSAEPMVMNFNLVDEGKGWKIVGYDFTNVDQVRAAVAPDSVRALVQRHFAHYATKSISGWMDTFLLGADPAMDEQRKKAFESIVRSTGKIEIASLSIDNVKADAHRGSAQATVVLKADHVQTGEPYFPSEPFVFDFQFVRDRGYFKISDMQVKAPPGSTSASETAPAVADVKPDTEKMLFRSETGRFAVLFPGKPTEATESWGDGMTGYKFDVFSGGNRYAINYGDFDAETVAKITPPREFLRVFRGGYRRGAKFQAEKEISVGKREVPGIDYQLESAPGVFVREQLLMDGVRMYVVFLMSPQTEFLTSAEANAFFDSLEIGE